MKPTAQRRRDRRDLLDNLLSRALRGNLTTAEAALLAESVRDEQRAYDQTRRSLAETGTAYGKHRAAADDAIREMEQRALDAEEQLTAYRSVLGPRPLDRIRDAEQRAAQAEELLSAAHQCSNDAETARAEAVQHLTAYVDIFGPDAVDDFHAMQHRAKIAEGRLTRIRDMADAWESRLPATIRTATAAEAVRRAAHGDDRPVMFSMTDAPADDDQAVTVAPVPEPYRAPAGDPVAALARIRDAHRWADVQAQLGMYYGWTAEQSGQRARAYRLDAEERADKAEERAEAASRVGARHLAERDRFEAAWQSARDRANVHAQHAERLKNSNKRWYGRAVEQMRRAKKAETALDEQRQALATALHARDDHEWPALIDWAAQAHEWASRAAVKADRKRVEELEQERAVIAAELHAARHKADMYRAAWHSARDRARRHAAEEKRVRGWLEHWADRARAAEPRAARYRLAWLACRRDRKADRAAMAAELPIVQAFRREFQARTKAADEFADTARADLITCPEDCPCRAVCIAIRP
ncbi:hypothetical protein RKD32_003985 [Streptomyces sp. SAI-195]|uniref:hypothetical protein n=1 Tax=Streptomyces sp. SAI-195 TaxID=3377734 RepID=UPI003C7E2968